MFLKNGEEIGKKGTNFRMIFVIFCWGDFLSIAKGHGVRRADYDIDWRNGGERK